MYMLGITFNHLPKNDLIWLVSVRLSEFLRTIKNLGALYELLVLDTLRAEDQVSDFLIGETPYRRPGT